MKKAVTVSDEVGRIARADEIGYWQVELRSSTAAE
jgi:hypothetical protein